MRSLIFLSLAVLPAPSTLAQETPYPVTEILEAFRNGCGTLEHQTAASASLVAHGWEPIPVNEESGSLGDFLAFSRNLGANAAAAASVDIGRIEAFKKNVAGEQVFIVLDEVRAEDARVSGCQLYDFNEARPITPDSVTKWLNRQATEVLNRPEMQTAEWLPGLLPNHDSFKIFFVPKGSPAAQRLRFTGVALKSDTVGVE